jgi:hypothetical protein
MHTLVRKLSFFGCAMRGLALTAPAAPQPADHVGDKGETCA